jgi:predicted transcriptional regulator
MELVQKLPDDVSTEDVMEALYFQSVLDQGLAQADAGQLISHEDAKKRLAKWLDK